MSKYINNALNVTLVALGATCGVVLTMLICPTILAWLT